MSIIIQLQARYGGSTNAPTESKPILSVVGEPTPTSAVFSLAAYGGGEYIVYASQSPDFTTIAHTRVVTEGDNAEFNDIPLLGEWYFRGKKNTAESVLSDPTLIIFEQTALRSLTITANAGNAQITIVHDCASDEPNVSLVKVKRRTALTSFVEIGTFSPSTDNYVDSPLTNGTGYFYELEMVSNNDDFSNSVSNTDSATPEAVTPTLSTPMPTMTWDLVTEGTGVLSWPAITFATSYDVYRNDVLVENTATLSSAFASQTVGVSVKYGVVAKAVGYVSSPQGFINRSAPDLDAEYTTPEEFGAEAYYKPLDGRRELWNYKSPMSFLEAIMTVGDPLYLAPVEATTALQQAADIAAAQVAYDDYCDAEILAGRYTDYPLITYTPFTQMSSGDKDLLTGASLSGTNYTLITATVNTFTAEDASLDGEGQYTKRFCGMGNNLNGNVAAFVDEYIPFKVSARYANVCLYKSATEIFVDFEFNGGDISTPQIQTSGKGYLYFDNTTAINNMVASLNLVSANRDIRWAELTYSDKLITAYVAPHLNLPSVNLNYNWILQSIGTRSRLKYGIEDYYYLQLNDDGAVKKYPLNNSSLTVTDFSKTLFQLTGSLSTTRFVTHNLQIVPAHGILAAALPTKNKLVSGTNNNMLAFVNTQSGVERDALVLADNLTTEKFVIALGDVSGGAYTGTGTSLMHDVSKMSYQFHHDFDFAGAWALGQVGGANKGGNYTLANKGKFNFGNQSEFAPGSNTFQMRFVTNHSTLGSHLQANAHLPTHSLEAEPEGNFLIAHTAGGNYRNLCYHIDKAVFFADFVGNAKYRGYWQLFYRDYVQNLSTSKGLATLTTNGRQAFLCANLPVRTESDTTTPKHYVISRGYGAKQHNGQHNSLGTTRPITVLNLDDNYVDVSYAVSGAAGNTPRLAKGLKVMFKGDVNPTTQFTVNSVTEVLPATVPKIWRFVLDEPLTGLVLGDGGISTMEEVVEVPTIGIPFKDGIITHPNWQIPLKKYALDLTEDDLDYINEGDNKQPLEFQILDQFTNCAWVKVADSSSFAKGDVVTDTTTGARGVIRRIDTYINNVEHRIIIGEMRTWNGAEWTRDLLYDRFSGTSITNGAETEDILAASTFDPKVIHEVVRKQISNFSGSDYSVSSWETWIDVEDTSIFATSNGAINPTIPVLINGTINAKVTFKSSLAKRITLNVYDNRHKIPAGATIVRIDNSAETTASVTSDLLDKEGNYYVHNGVGGQQSVGITMSAKRSNMFGSVNLQGYYYSDVKVSPALPDDVNDDLDGNPMFDIEMINSECEYLLDGNYYDACHTYLELNKYGESGLTMFNNNGSTSANGSRTLRNQAGSARIGYGTSGFSNNLTGFLTPSAWPRNNAGSLGHGRYSVAENSFDYRFCDFFNSYLRTNGSSTVNTFNLGDGGEVVYSLMYYMKAFNLIGCINYTPFESLVGGSGGKSPNKHMDKMRRIYAKYLADNGIEYVPPYAADGLPVRPMMHVHRTSVGTSVILNEGLNVDKSNDISNMPQYPQPIIDLMTELGETL